MAEDLTDVKAEDLPLLDAKPKKVTKAVILDPEVAMLIEDLASINTMSWSAVAALLIKKGITTLRR